MHKLNKIPQFLREVREELRHVNWLNREQNLRYTFLVLAVCAGVGIYLGILDWGFGNLIANYLLK